MPMLGFIHSPTRIPQPGPLHRLHYQCSITPFDDGERPHHHDLLARLAVPDITLPIPSPEDHTVWVLAAANWHRFFAHKAVALIDPGTQLRRGVSPKRRTRMATARTTP